MNDILEIWQTMARIQFCTIAISHCRNSDPKFIKATIDKAASSIAALGSTHIFLIKPDEHTLVLTNHSKEKFASYDDDWLFSHAKNALSADGKLLSARELLSRALLEGADGFSDIEPPFLALTAKPREIEGLSDKVGLGHLFWWQGEDCAAICTSASVIAHVFGCPFDEFGLFQQMTIGHQIGNTTMFEGVSMLEAGAKAHLTDGKITIKLAKPVHALPLVRTIEEGGDVIRAALDRCLSALPDAGVELSGGLDSRMTLAAIPIDYRDGRNAYTIGYRNSPDVETAKRLVQDFKLAHEIVDLSTFNNEAPEKILERVKRVVHRDDFSTNIYDRLTIDCVDDHLLDKSRIGGVNGEFARGFYYAAMPVTKPATSDIISRLVAWRLTTNDAAPKEMFASNRHAEYSSVLSNYVFELFKPSMGVLGQALDQFYLYQRMRRWAGGAITRAMADRQILVPFFHSEFVSWANGLPVSAKKDSLGFNRVLQAIDPALASIPLDTGLVPSRLARGGSAMQLAGLRNKASKVIRKVSQRFAGVRQQTLGSESLQQKLANREITANINWSAIHNIGFFDEEMLEKLRQGQIPYSRTTLGYLLPLSFQIEYLAQKASQPKLELLKQN